MSLDYFMNCALREFTDNLAVMTFREVIRPPLWLIGFIYFLLLSLVIAIWAAFDNQTALLAWIAATIAIVAIAVTWRQEIIFDGSELRVGQAHIELRYIKDVIVADRDSMRILRTRDADPAAFLAIAFWIPIGVQVILDDKRDPTPYWLISSRKCEELKRTLCRSL
jgi:hypothetical protein